MNHLQDLLDSIRSQRDALIARTIAWSHINSHTPHFTGCARMADVVSEELAALGASVERFSVDPARAIDDAGREILTPLGPVVIARKRPDATRRVLLNIHLDTVYPPDHPFQQTRWLDDATLHGPGVADAKGGIVVLLAALAAFERSELASRIGWTVLLNSDEEIGSPGSAPLLRAEATRHDIGLVFEPATAAGNLVGPRKGSGTFTFVVRGRTAHAGRDFVLGRSAVVAMSQLVLDLHALNDALGEGVVVNVGRVNGGGAVNAVPDLAIVRVNVRTTTASDEQRLRIAFAAAVDRLNARDGIRAQIHGDFFSPPKPLEGRSLDLMNDVLAAGRELGLNLSHKPGGGTCDGNKLAAAGLAVVDSLGPVGGGLHTPDEFIKVDSLVERAQLAALVLLNFAAGSS